MAMSKASGRGRGRWARSGRALEEQQVLSALSHLSLLLTWALKNIDIDGKFGLYYGGIFSLCNGEQFNNCLGSFHQYV